MAPATTNLVIKSIAKEIGVMDVVGVVSSILGAVWDVFRNKDFSYDMIRNEVLNDIQDIYNNEKVESMRLKIDIYQREIENIMNRCDISGGITDLQSIVNDCHLGTVFNLTSDEYDFLANEISKLKLVVTADLPDFILSNDFYLSLPYFKEISVINLALRAAQIAMSKHDCSLESAFKQELKDQALYDYNYMMLAIGDGLDKEEMLPPDFEHSSLITAKGNISSPSTGSDYAYQMQDDYIRGLQNLSLVYSVADYLALHKESETAVDERLQVLSGDKVAFKVLWAKPNADGDHYDDRCEMVPPIKSEEGFPYWFRCCTVFVTSCTNGVCTKSCPCIAEPCVNGLEGSHIFVECDPEDYYDYHCVNMVFEMYGNSKSRGQPILNCDEIVLKYIYGQNRWVISASNSEEVHAYSTCPGDSLDLNGGTWPDGKCLNERLYISVDIKECGEPILDRDAITLRTSTQEFADNLIKTSKDCNIKTEQYCPKDCAPAWRIYKQGSPLGGTGLPNSLFKWNLTYPPNTGSSFCEMNTAQAFPQTKIPFFLCLFAYSLFLLA